MRGALVGLIMIVMVGCGGGVSEAPVEVVVETTIEIVLSTPPGEIVLELYPERAPITAKNFLQYVEAGSFVGATFYRVVRPENNNGVETMQLIQGGIYGREMAGEEVEIDDPFPPIAHETTEMTGIRHERGVISMARLDPGTASSEFFILVTDAPELDFGGMRNPDGQGFAAFGHVISGMDVVETIRRGLSDAPTDNEYVRGQILNDPIEIIGAARR